MVLAKVTRCASLGLGLMLTLVLLSACSFDSETEEYSLVEESTLNVAMSLDNPPFAYYEDGVAAGFEVAVIQEVASRLGLACSISDVDSDDVVSSVEEAQSYDVGLSSLTATKERKSLVDFTSSYYYADQAIVVPKDTYLTVDEIDPERIAACTESAALSYAESEFGEDILVYSNIAACFHAFESDRIEAVVADSAVVAYLISHGYSDYEILETDITNDAYAIAVSQDNSVLTDAINEVLDDMKYDGTLESLQNQNLI